MRDPLPACVFHVTPRACGRVGSAFSRPVVSRGDTPCCVLGPHTPGEFVVMNYRVTGEFRAPFRLFPFVEETSPYKVELVLKVCTR